ncbi:unnamed protein product [Bursaphelenchus okinawaensis]|uniref:IMD domain-containing protein n=1 Tax=Bursaphelenchus okinawaensis TaxID=465554 RepID=A0A811JTA8_9BILA|nr:unnamed protein product [Bursaphelenchus okinawaensis]CAG9082298.1 unnamed protein product [Bursaphelenchus okinawaensis]
MGTEFESMQGLCESVLSDLKSTNCAWEVMSTRASKLATQLNNTAICLSNFVDCLQIVSDSANSIKGASRDIGAALTRFCLRQRTLQSDLKAFSSVISNNFCPTLESRSSEWKQNVSELQRKNHRVVKKKRSKKDMGEVVVEQKQFCTELLLNQRQLFLGFMDLLMPLIKAEITLLEEGVHIKEIQESVEMDVLHSDSALVVKAAVEDALADEQTYRKRMTSPSRSTSSSKVSSRLNHSSKMNTSPSTSSSTFNWADVESKVFSPKSLVDGKPGYHKNKVDKPPFLSRGSNDGSLGVSPALSISASDVSVMEDCVFYPPKKSWAAESQRDFSETMSQLNDDISSMCSRSSTSKGTMDSVRQRRASVRIPPPPPERRNSSIMAATPDAPSIVDFRSGLVQPSKNIVTNDDYVGARDIDNAYWTRNKSEHDIY